LIDGFFEKRPRVGIANEQPPVLDLDIMVENDVGGGVHIDDKPVLVDCDRGRRIVLSAAVGEVLDPGAPATEAISIRRRVKEARMHSSSARKWLTSEFMSKIAILDLNHFQRSLTFEAIDYGTAKKLRTVFHLRPSTWDARLPPPFRSHESF